MIGSPEIEIPDDVSVLDDDEDLDAFGPPTWRDRMAFGFAKEIVHPMDLTEEGIRKVVSMSFELADEMIRQSKYRVE